MAYLTRIGIRIEIFLDAWQRADFAGLGIGPDAGRLRRVGKA